MRMEFRASRPKVVVDSVLFEENGLGAGVTSFSEQGVY